MEKRLYASIALTMTEDRVSLLKSKHAIAIVINAAPASVPIKIATGSVSDVPSNMVTIEEGTMASANPVAPSISAVIVSNDFNLFEV